MIKASERKESAGMIQFRAPSEYLHIIDIVTLAINRKIKAVGSTDFYNVTDVMKLSIEALSTGNNTVNILNKTFFINELVEEELSRFYSNSYKDEILPIILSAFKKYLIDALKEIESNVHQTKIDDKSYQGDKYLSEISGVLGIWSSDVNNIDIEAGISEIYDISQKVKISVSDCDDMEREIENILMEDEYFEFFQGLKLKNRYRYSLILTYVREEISKLVAKFQSICEKTDNSLIEDPFK